MDVDLGATLQDVTSESATKRKRAEELILSKEQEDFVSWVHALASLIISPSAEPMAKLCASLVLKQALNRRSLTAPKGKAKATSAAGGGAGGEARGGGGYLWRTGRSNDDGSEGSMTDADPAGALGPLLLEAWAAAVQDRRLRAILSCSVARAAAIQFVNGQAWPELGQCLAHWSAGSKDKQDAALQFFELLQEEVELQEEHPSFASARASLLSLMAFLEDQRHCQHQIAAAPTTTATAAAAAASTTAAAAAAAATASVAGGLCRLLNAALEDELGQEARITASRLFVFLTTCEAVPALLRESVRDLVSSTLAQACQKRRIDEEDGLSCCIPCLQAVVLAAHADPTRWSALARGSNGLALALLEEVTDPKLFSKSRAAALVALLELMQSHRRAAEEDVNAMDGDDEDDDEIVPRLLQSFRQVFLSLPEDEETEEWAEGNDEDEVKPRGDRDGDEEDLKDGDDDEGRRELFDEVLDACARLCSERGLFYRELEGLAGELMRGEAWQSKHSGLLLQLRLASAAVSVAASSSSSSSALAPISDDADAASSAAALDIARRTYEAAAQCLHHVHPRVRWAALEVWARLLVANVGLPDDILDPTLNVLIDVAGADPYLRVRSRALLVLLTMTSAALLQPRHADALFRKALVPTAERVDEDRRGAACRIGTSCAMQWGWLELQQGGHVAAASGDGAASRPPAPALAAAATDSSGSADAGTDAGAGAGGWVAAASLPADAAALWQALLVASQTGAQREQLVEEEREKARALQSKLSAVPRPSAPQQVWPSDWR